MSIFLWNTHVFVANSTRLHDSKNSGRIKSDVSEELLISLSIT